MDFLLRFERSVTGKHGKKNTNVKGAAVRKSAVFYQAIDLPQESHLPESLDERAAFVTGI